MDENYTELVKILEELEDTYISLGDVIRLERRALLEADLDSLQASNIAKEDLIRKAKQVDGLREAAAHRVGKAIGINSEHPRLLEIAQKIDPFKASPLKDWHRRLESCVREVADLNRANEIYAHNALKVIRGALGNVKDVVSGKKTYHRAGKLTEGPDQSGNFVSREA